MRQRIALAAIIFLCLGSIALRIWPVAVSLRTGLDRGAPYLPADRPAIATSGGLSAAPVIRQLAAPEPPLQEEPVQTTPVVSRIPQLFGIVTIEGERAALLAGMDGKTITASSGDIVLGWNVVQVFDNAVTLSSDERTLTLHLFREE